MARSIFAGEVTDLAVAPDVNNSNALKMAPNTAYPLYDAPNGNLVQDFLLWDGNAFTVAATGITSDGNGLVPAFQGPDGTTVLYDAHGAALIARVTSLPGAVDSYADVEAFPDYPETFPPDTTGFGPATVNLGAVDNTSDEDKPVSAATEAALNEKQDSIPTFATLTLAQAAVNAGTLLDEDLCVIVDPNS